MKKLMLILLLSLVQVAAAAPARLRPAGYNNRVLPQRAGTGSTTNNTASTQKVSEDIAADDKESDEEKRNREMIEFRERAVRAKSDVSRICGTIFPQLQDIQMLTGVAVTVSAVGTATGAMSFVTGLMKFKADATIEELEEQKKFILTLTDSRAMLVWLNMQAEMQQNLEEQSKTLGDLRTGGLAVTTVTSATSAISSLFTSKKLEIVIDKINICKQRVDDLKTVYDDYSRAYPGVYDVILAQVPNVVATCGALETESLDSIKKRMTAVAVVSGIGGVSAVGGTVASAMANSDDIRADDSDKGKKKEKNLNMAANVTAGVSAATSGVSTLISATSAAKLTKNAETAAKCSDFLRI